jgi:hypothetical protein
MKIDWNETICGLRMIELRNLTRKMFDEKNIAFIAAKSGLSEPACQSLARMMIERGWWQQIEPGFYRATVTGNAMAMSKKLPPLTRASAEALLERVISTAHEINADPDMAYDITYLAVFGSYLRDTPTLNDLDIAYVATGRWPGGGEDSSDMFERMITRQNEAYPQAWSGTLPSILWAGIAVRKRLKVTNRVSVHDREEIDTLGWPQRVLIDVNAPAAADG